jgi:hypothetical protein
MLTAQSRQKSYAYKHCRKLEFNIGDLVYLKVSSMRGVIRFGKKGKLSPRFVGPFEVKEIVGLVAYKIHLPPALSGIHGVFHVSTPRKHVRGPLHIVDFENCKSKKILNTRNYQFKFLIARNNNLERRPFHWLKSFGKITM